LGFGGRPGEGAGGRVDCGSCRSADQGEGQSVGRQVGIGGSRCKAKQSFLSNCLVANRAEYGCKVDFGDGDGDFFLIAQDRVAIVADFDGEGVFASALGLGGRPGESASGRVDCGSGRSINQAVG